MKKQKKKDVYFKKYLYLVLIFGVILILILYIFEWVKVKDKEKLMNSYLISSNTISNVTKDIDSINQIMMEAPSNYFIYLGYTGEEYEYNLEKNLKRVIDNYGLNDVFYYIDVTGYKDNLNEINNKLNLKLESIPAIIFIYEGRVIESQILDGVKGSKLNIQEFENLLDIYDYEPVK